MKSSVLKGMSYQREPIVRACWTTTSGRNVQLRGAISTGSSELSSVDRGSFLFSSFSMEFNRSPKKSGESSENSRWKEWCKILIECVKGGPEGAKTSLPVKSTAWQLLQGVAQRGDNFTPLALRGSSGKLSFLGGLEGAFWKALGDFQVFCTGLYLNYSSAFIFNPLIWPLQVQKHYGQTFFGGDFLDYRFRIPSGSGLWKRCFCPQPKHLVLTKRWRKLRFTFYQSKQGASLLTSQKPTRMTKMARVTPSKPPFAKNTVFTTPSRHHPERRNESRISYSCGPHGTWIIKDTVADRN